jgi:site-specific DNA recombinase
MARKARKSASPKKTRLIGYIRVSTEEQAKEGVSLASQRERLAAYALAHGAELVGIEADEGISGGKAPSKRPGISAAMGRLKSGEADGLIVVKLDRLTRSTRDCLALVDQMRDSGWHLVSVNEHLDTESAAGRLVLTVLAALSEMEREQIAERVTEAMGHIAREGRGRSHRLPFGLCTADGEATLTEGDTRKLCEQPEEQKQLRTLKRGRKQGMGARKLAALLNHKHKGNPRTGKLWTPSAIQSMVRNLDIREAALAA